MGSYQVISLVGAGGMGEVYQAHDTKLGRDVAIKVLPEALAQAPERLARFQREAKLLASLNHPNIATIHGLEQSGDTHYLVMELVPGETLRERVAGGPVPVEEALTIAKQIAEALEAAHNSEKVIIHRDLKPENVKVTPEGRVKVLDFGLAKAVWGADEPTELDMNNSPTLSMAATRQGVILGTAAYMSPEQARGQTVDRRTDVWGFGGVFYELLTGKRPFQGETSPETIAAVLEREPDWQALPAKTPTKIRELLWHCLQKDANLRLGNIADARRIIEEAQRGSKRRHVVAAAAAVAILVTGGIALGMRGPARLADRSQWVQLTQMPDSVSQPALSPDGRLLAFIRVAFTFF
jgi:serine/threonine protein kinase